MSTNQQRREAAKRKLEKQLARRAEEAKRNRIIAVVATVAVVVVVTGVVVFLATRSDEPAQPEEKDTELSIPTERAPVPERKKPLADPTSCKYPKSKQEPAKKVKAPANGKFASSGTVDVSIETTAGTIGMTLDRALAPCTVNSMVSLMKQGYYDDSECHRLGTQGLQILQCGDPTATGQGGPGYTFNDETFQEIKYGRGLLAMANAGANTNGGQFFMVYGDAVMTDGSGLPPLYNLFGTIDDEGLAVLDKVARAGVGEPGPDGTGKPAQQVKFTKLTVSE